jgi:hypothetical protein
MAAMGWRKGQPWQAPHGNVLWASAAAALVAKIVPAAVRMLQLWAASPSVNSVSGRGHWMLQWTICHCVLSCFSVGHLYGMHACQCHACIIADTPSGARMCTAGVASRGVVVGFNPLARPLARVAAVPEGSCCKALCTHQQLLPACLHTPVETLLCTRCQQRLCCALCKTTARALA